KGAGVSSGSLIESSGTGSGTGVGSGTASGAGDGVEFLVLFLSSISSGERASSSGSPNQSSGPGATKSGGGTSFISLTKDPNFKISQDISNMGVLLSSLDTFLVQLSNNNLEITNDYGLDNIQ
ncbi:hypothetical protein WICPIJ_008229, partial [Wickerhamomyces pijperi]